MAQDCIRYLKDQRVGTCTFLPLDNITVKPLSERVRSFGSKYRPCVDLLECDEAFKVHTSECCLFICDAPQFSIY